MLTSAVLAISTLDVVYLGQDQLLLHRPATGAYSLHQYARYARAPCAGLAPEPVYAGTVGVKNSRFASLGGGVLLQVDPSRGSYVVRRCGGAERLHLGLRAACPVVVEGAPQRGWVNMSLLPVGGGAGGELLLLYNDSLPRSAGLRGYRFDRGAMDNGGVVFEQLPLSGLVWRDGFERRALAALGGGLLLDYEPQRPSRYRVWRANPRCAVAGGCNTASDPPLQGPVHEGTFPHASRRFIGLSTDVGTAASAAGRPGTPAAGGLLHVMELDPSDESYRVLVCDGGARLSARRAAPARRVAAACRVAAAPRPPAAPARAAHAPSAPCPQPNSRSALRCRARITSGRRRCCRRRRARRSRRERRASRPPAVDGARSRRRASSATRARRAAAAAHGPSGRRLRRRPSPTPPASFRGARRTPPPLASAATHRRPRPPPRRAAAAATRRRRRRTRALAPACSLTLRRARACSTCRPSLASVRAAPSGWRRPRRTRKTRSFASSSRRSPRPTTPPARCCCGRRWATRCRAARSSRRSSRASSTPTTRRRGRSTTLRSSPPPIRPPSDRRRAGWRSPSSSTTTRCDAARRAPPAAPPARRAPIPHLPMLSSPQLAPQEPPPPRPVPPPAARPISPTPQI